MKIQHLAHRSAGLLCLASALFLTACGEGFQSNVNVPAGSPAQITALSAEPRVDLPGRVSVFLSVEEADGTPASGLTGEDFKIYENGTLVSQSESFQQIRAQPQLFRSYLHLVLDRSNSVQTAGETALKTGARAFIELLAKDDETTFIRISYFDGSPDLFPIPGHDIGFTDSREDLLNAIDDLDAEPPTNGSTNLYGAVVSGIELLNQVDQEANLAGVPNRSLSLVTFTDGTHQSGDSVTLDDARAAISGMSTAGNRYNAFTIGVGAEIDPIVLALLGPNGTVAEENFDELSSAFEEVGMQVFDLANSFYSLTYCSPKTSGDSILTVSVLEERDPNSDVDFLFNADGFGAGCAFFDVNLSEEIGDGQARVFVADAVEAADGSVYAVGWRTAGCLEPGCGTSATAFVAKFRASPGTATLEEAAGDGRLDLTFGTGGVLALEDAQFDVSGATSIVRSSLVAGGFAVGGWARVSSASGFSEAVLWEVDGNGTSAARVDLPGAPGLPDADQAITDLVALPSGDYAASGFYGMGQRTFLVWRTFPNFDLDAGFGTGGVVVGPGTTLSSSGATTLTLGAGGRLYAAGEVGTGIRVLALNGTTGALLPAFDGDGVLELAGLVDGLVYPVTLGAVAIDGQGRLILAGSIIGAPPQVGTGTAQPALWRLTSSGTLDTTFTGSLSSPTVGTGLVTLRSSATDNVNDDFGRSTALNGLALGPDGTIITTGQRQNRQLHTDLVNFAFTPSGVSSGGYNFVGFAIHDGAVSDKSFESGSVVKILSTGAIWSLGVGYPTAETTTSTAGLRSDDDVPVVWVDRDPLRAFPPIGE